MAVRLIPGQATISNILRSMKLSKEFPDRMKRLRKLKDIEDMTGKKKISEIEAEGAAVIEGELGITIGQTTGIKGGDYLITKGKGNFKSGETVDHMGPDATSAKYFDAQWSSGKFQKSIDKHIHKADYVLLDMRYLNDAQKKQINQYLEKFSDVNRKFIILD